MRASPCSADPPATPLIVACARRSAAAPRGSFKKRSCRRRGRPRTGCGAGSRAAAPACSRGAGGARSPPAPGRRCARTHRGSPVPGRSALPAREVPWRCPHPLSRARAPRRRREERPVRSIQRPPGGPFPLGRGATAGPSRARTIRQVHAALRPGEHPRGSRVGRRGRGRRRPTARRAAIRWAARRARRSG